VLVGEVKHRSAASKSLLYGNPYPTQHLPISPPKTTSHFRPNYGVIPTVPRVSLAGSPDQKLAQSLTVCSGTRRQPVLTNALPGIADLCPGGLFPFSTIRGTNYGQKTNLQQKTETGTLKKPTEMPNTCSNIRTSTVLKGPHPKLGMSGGRKPAANVSVTGDSAPKTAVGTAKALGPPAGANKFTYADRRTAWTWAGTRAASRWCPAMVSGRLTYTKRLRASSVRSAKGRTLSH